MVVNKCVRGFENPLRTCTPCWKKFPLEYDYSIILLHSYYTITTTTELTKNQVYFIHISRGLKSQDCVGLSAQVLLGCHTTLCMKGKQGEVGTRRGS